MYLSSRPKRFRADAGLAPVGLTNTIMLVLAW